MIGRRSSRQTPPPARFSSSLRSHPTPLAHVTQTLLPLIHRLIDLAIGPESIPTTANERPEEAKPQEMKLVQAIMLACPPILQFRALFRDTGDKCGLRKFRYQYAEYQPDAR